MKITLIVIISILFNFFLPHPVFAQNCRPLYGGGVTQETVCDTQPNKASPTPVRRVPTATKGGLPVLTPAPQQSTPSTGPEMLGIIALVPAAGLGLYLRKKNY